MKLFEITDDALEKMRALIAEEKIDSEKSVVRLYVNGMGASGLTWGLCFDEAVDGDTVKSYDDFDVLVESALLDALGGIRVEYEDNIWGGGFNVIPQDPEVDFGGGCHGSCDGCSGCGGGCGGFC